MLAVDALALELVVVVVVVVVVVLPFCLDAADGGAAEDEKGDDD